MEDLSTQAMISLVIPYAFQPRRYLKSRRNKCSRTLIHYKEVSQKASRQDSKIQDTVQVLLSELLRR